MKQEIPINPANPAALRQAMQDIQADLKLSGNPSNGLLRVADDVLSYISSLLSNASPVPPELSLDEWSDILSTLKSHWMIPLLYQQMGTLPKECLPPDAVTDQMRMAFLESRVCCLNMERQLGEILDAFQEEGIRLLVVRGPALAWSLYPDPAMRPSSDLDLLVLPEQMLQARATLERLHYKCLGKRFEFARDFFREEAFVHQENPRDNLVVDLHWLHWELHPFFRDNCGVGIQDLFHRALRVSSSGLTFETLHPVDALIHAAIHLALIHGRAIRLLWVYDIALLARQLQVPYDWQVLIERSVAWRGRLALEHCLRMAHVWFGLRLPDEFNDFSTWPRPTEDERGVWADVTKHHWIIVLLKRYISGPSGFLKAIRSLFRLLFPDPKIVRYCYPPSRDWLIPLSYVRRWHRWFLELVVSWR
jgi:hypothetical protein